MRRNGQPSRPSAMTCCRFSSLKTLLTSMEGTPHRFQCLVRFLLAGFQASLIGRFWASPEDLPATRIRPFAEVACVACAIVGLAVAGDISRITPQAPR